MPVGSGRQRAACFLSPANFYFFDWREGGDIVGGATMHTILQKDERGKMVISKVGYASANRSTSALRLASRCWQRWLFVGSPAARGSDGPLVLPTITHQCALCVCVCVCNFFYSSSSPILNFYFYLARHAPLGPPLPSPPLEPGPWARGPAPGRTPPGFALAFGIVCPAQSGALWCRSAHCTRAQGLFTWFAVALGCCAYLGAYHWPSFQLSATHSSTTTARLA